MDGQLRRMPVLDSTKTMSLANQAQQEKKRVEIGTIQVSDLRLQSKEALTLAAGFIDTYVERDLDFPDLEDLLKVDRMSEYVFSPDATDLGPTVPFMRSDLLNIPDEIFEQYNRKFNI
jgi:nuclear pore complex protein Nup155